MRQDLHSTGSSGGCRHPGPALGHLIPPVGVAGQASESGCAAPRASVASPGPREFQCCPVGQNTPGPGEGCHLAKCSFSEGRHLAHLSPPICHVLRGEAWKSLQISKSLLDLSFHHLFTSSHGLGRTGMVRESAGGPLWPPLGVPAADSPCAREGAVLRLSRWSRTKLSRCVQQAALALVWWQAGSRDSSSP